MNKWNSMSRVVSISNFRIKYNSHKGRTAVKRKRNLLTCAVLFLISPYGKDSTEISDFSEKRQRRKKGNK